MVSFCFRDSVDAPSTPSVMYQSVLLPKREGNLLVDKTYTKNFSDFYRDLITMRISLTNFFLGIYHAAFPRPGLTSNENYRRSVKPPFSASPRRNQVHPFVECPFVHFASPACDSLCGLHVAFTFIVLVIVSRGR
ncbi:hypothetical protein C2E23DRAFT_841441 [Lenzites betulinus]|nr:hypothetical protein C2E23DRAFT_841441 [Lenzites betulinus]